MIGSTSAGISLPNLLKRNGIIKLYFKFLAFASLCNPIRGTLGPCGCVLAPLGSDGLTSELSVPSGACKSEFCLRSLHLQIKFKIEPVAPTQANKSVPTWTICLINFVVFLVNRIIV
uniref:Uncharacterized protein n=1 Tax=Pyrrhoderma lamaoense TaxID=2282106 RepID=A0A5B9RB92_9AGAM|nr:hypothetical protein PLAO_000054 [Phellinus lamaoensis]QEG57124.1 hypothetical protein PLAO_000054 [Phellinus lamaoensis]